MMKRLCITLTVAVLAFVGHSLAPTETSAEPYYCDGGSLSLGPDTAQACGSIAGQWVQLGPCVYVPGWGGNFQWAYHPSYGHAWLPC